MNKPNQIEVTKKEGKFVYYYVNGGDFDGTEYKLDLKTLDYNEEEGILHIDVTLLYEENFDATRKKEFDDIVSNDIIKRIENAILMEESV